MPYSKLTPDDKASAELLAKAMEYLSGLAVVAWTDPSPAHPAGLNS